MTIYSGDNCVDELGSMANVSGVGGCFATPGLVPANSFYIEFFNTNDNGGGDSHVSDGDPCSGPGTEYDGAHPGLNPNSCQVTSANGCFGISKYQQPYVLYDGEMGNTDTCLGI
jgi:hypothetical protein